jgi:hypothetical protein
MPMPICTNPGQTKPNAQRPSQARCDSRNPLQNIELTICECSISRRMALGAIRRFQADEYVMMAILCFYTVVIVTINIVEHTSSNLLPPGYDIAHMTKQDIAERTVGSKLILVVENCQIITIWGAKTCLLIMYLRLTTLRRENIAIKALLAYVGVTFVVMEVLYLGVWCRPFHNYWVGLATSRMPY